MNKELSYYEVLCVEQMKTHLAYISSFCTVFEEQERERERIKLRHFTQSYLQNFCIQTD